MTTEELAKRRAWAESHFGDKNLTDEELDCATYMPSENFSDGWDKGSEWALQNQWIPVDERLPEPMQRVFVWIGDEALVCWYTKSGRFKTTLRSKERYSEDKSLHEKIHLSPCREDVTDVVTHWMDTPKLNPEKE